MKTILSPATLASLASLIGVFLIPSASAQVWDGGASTSNWFDANNWDPTGVPAGSSVININTSTTVVMDSAATGAATLNQSNNVQIGGTNQVIDFTVRGSQIFNLSGQWVGNGNNAAPFGSTVTRFEGSSALNVSGTNLFRVASNGVNSLVFRGNSTMLDTRTAGGLFELARSAGSSGTLLLQDDAIFNTVQGITMANAALTGSVVVSDNAQLNVGPGGAISIGNQANHVSGRLEIVGSGASVSIDSSFANALVMNTSKATLAFGLDSGSFLASPRIVLSSAGANLSNATLDLYSLAGFAITAGQSIDLIDAGQTISMSGLSLLDTTGADFSVAVINGVGTQDFLRITANATVIPEPSTLLHVLGVVMLVALKRRRRVSI